MVDFLFKRLRNGCRLVRCQCSVIMDKINKEQITTDDSRKGFERQKAENNKWFLEDSEMHGYLDKEQDFLFDCVNSINPCMFGKRHCITHIDEHSKCAVFVFSIGHER